MHAKLKNIMVILSILAIANLAYASGSGTLTRISGWYDAGTNLSITAVPEDAYTRFDGWSGDTNGIAGLQGSNITFTVDGARSLMANFSLIRTSEGNVPYAWLATWTNEFELAVTDDWDGDGLTTEQEYWSGTDPNDANSVLRVTGLEQAAGVLRFAWSHAHVDARIPPVRIERRTNLLHGVWEYVGEISPSNGVNYFEPPAGEQGYYRLAVTNAP